MRRLSVIFALSLAACSAAPPSGFGVDLTVDATGLSSGQRAQVTTFDLYVSGAETYKTSIAVTRSIGKGEVRVRYIPAISSGSLTFGINALDASGKVVSAGSVGPVTLSSGRATNARLVLAAGAQACSDASQCGSGFCVDGLCCDGACNGVCESCNQPESAGRCSAIAANTDPDNECGPTIGNTDVDGGTDSDAGFVVADMAGIYPPAGGIQRDPSKCAGTCSGQRSCNFPGATQSCGPGFCNTPAQPIALGCNSHGGCELAPTACTNYVCDPSTVACKTTCSANSDCLPGEYCNVNTNACVPKKAIGLQCNAVYECASGYCVGGTGGPTRFCCNSPCNDTGMSCNTPGTEGSCACQGKTCANGCGLFYVDADLDGHGDQMGTIAAGSALADCIGPASESSGGKTYYAPPLNDDCDDTDNRVHPNLPGSVWYTTAHPKWGFDYHCGGGNPVKQYSEFVGTSCQVCVYSGGCTNSGQTCQDSVYNAAGLVCGFYCQVGPPGNYKCCPGVTEGFTQTVACGTQAYYWKCGTCPPSSTFPTTVSNTATYQYQGCH